MPSVADAIVARLRDAGVRVLFGVPGGGSLDLIAAAGRARLPFVLTAAETAAAIAAIAQAEITGAPGACLTTIGPGVASVVNGVACARLERAPLLVLTDAATQGGVRSAHQRLDHRALLGPIAKWSATVLAANAVDTVAEAIRIAMAHPRGPVHLDCPSDVLSAEFDGQVDARAGAARDAPEPAGDAAFDSLIAGARRPLLLVGLGAREATAAAAIRELCASRGVPALVTYKG